MFYSCHHLTAEKQQLRQCGGRAQHFKSRSIPSTAHGTIPYHESALHESAGRSDSTLCTAAATNLSLPKIKRPRWALGQPSAYTHFHFLRGPPAGLLPQRSSGVCAARGTLMANALNRSSCAFFQAGSSAVVSDAPRALLSRQEP